MFSHTLGVSPKHPPTHINQLADTHCPPRTAQVHTLTGAHTGIHVHATSKLREFALPQLTTPGEWGANRASPPRDSRSYPVSSLWTHPLGRLSWGPSTPVPLGQARALSSLQVSVPTWGRGMLSLSLQFGGAARTPTIGGTWGQKQKNRGTGRWPASQEWQRDGERGKGEAEGFPLPRTRGGL